MDMHVTYTHLRQNLSSILDKVEEDSLICSVSRKGHEGVVIITETDYKALSETLHLLRTKANRSALDESQKQMEKGEYVTFSNVEDIDKYISGKLE